MTQGATAAVTADDLGLGPAHRLSVDKLYGGQWLRLGNEILVFHNNMLSNWKYNETNTPAFP